MRFGFSRLRCSFCGKRDNEIAKLVAGPSVRICDECVAVAAQIMNDAGPGDGRPATGPPSLGRRLAQRLRDWLQRGTARSVRSAAVTH
jgi:ClpX C4-type zinc finger